MSDQAKCELCGEPMPPGEEMFKFHGYSGSCPKPPLRVTSAPLVTMSLSEQAQLVADTRQRVLAEVRELVKAALCEHCGGAGWYEGTTSGHGCDGTEEGCARTCPVPVPIQIECACVRYVPSERLLEILAQLDTLAADPTPREEP